MLWLKEKVLKSNQMYRLAYWVAVAVSTLIVIGIWHNYGFIQTCGWIGSLAFAFSALPQALKSYREKHSDGVADGMMILWCIGEVTMLVYGFGIMQWPIIVNCFFNTIYIGIIVYYRLFPATEVS
jgi:uncharacterized protein with PQ loop repeat